jgi:hypothetical protein
MTSQLSYIYETYPLVLVFLLEMLSLLSLSLLLLGAVCPGGAIAPGLMSYVREAEFAVDELKKLSDSGVYSTLKLVDITEASKQV